MAKTFTEYTNGCKDGYLSSDGFSYTSDCVFGEESGHDFTGYIKFAALNLPGAVIRSITLTLKRYDTLGSRTFTFGINQSTAWGADMLSTFSVPISSGAGTKTVDLTSQIDLIKGFTSDWCVRTNVNRSGIGIVKCYGDEDGSNAPLLTVVYDEGLVYVYKNGVWVPCLMHMYKNGAFHQCMPYVYKNGVWTLV